MFIIQTYPLAVVFCFITMLCWGSWANTQKLAASNWRFELFYWDYVLGILAFSLLMGFSLGSLGDGGRPFVEDLLQAKTSAVTSAVIGGIVFNAANILLGAAIAIAGMSVAFPVGIGLALVIGVLINYMDTPLGNPLLIFTGVGFVGLAILLNAFAYRKLSIKANKVSSKGLALSIVSGGLMGLFYKYVAASMATEFHQPETGMLTPYTAVFLFSAGILASNVVFNTVLMARPFQGTPVSYGDYFQGGFKNHLMGIVGGSIWCMGMSFSILASEKAGPAISYGLGQGATVVAALWGIYVWKEFKQAPQGTNVILMGMLFFYVLGLSLIVLAR